MTYLDPELPGTTQPTGTPPLFPDESTIWKEFVLNVSVIILIFILGIFLGIQLNNEHLIGDELLTRARADFGNIVLVRKWAAQYHGVYVEKGPGVESNPYLKNPDIVSRDGKTYTLRNPALITREISQLSTDKEGHSFHITSLKPINPGNVADAFETASLQQFADGRSKESFVIEESGGRSHYRYMAPLFIEQPCLTCHSNEGYRVGDLRGGISVRFDITEVMEQLRWNRYAIWALSLTVAALLLVIVFKLVRKMRQMLDQAYARMRQQAVTDELTGLHNRRYFLRRFEGELLRSRRYGHPLACLMIDIDHFKRINDQYGHATGDQVLKAAAAQLRQQQRDSDLICRYGGEEFAILLPECERNSAMHVAERLRTAMAAAPLQLEDGRQFPLTISIGVSHLSGEQLESVASAEEILDQADSALYAAKRSGRNRVVAQSSP